MTYSVTSDRTKKSLAESLKKMMRQKPLNKISIREIVEDCGVNRQTFYYHFKDIYDLVEWMFDQEAIRLLKENMTFLTWEDSCLYLLNYIEQNWQVCTCTLNSLGRNHLESFFYKDLYSIVRSVIEEGSSDLILKEKYKDFLAHFYTVSFAAILISWIKGEMKLSAEELIEMISITINNNIRGATERFSKVSDPNPTKNESQ